MLVVDLLEHAWLYSGHQTLTATIPAVLYGYLGVLNSEGLMHEVFVTTIVV
jgi:hypothetical protein